MCRAHEKKQSKTGWNVISTRDQDTCAIGNGYLYIVFTYNGIYNGPYAKRKQLLGVAIARVAITNLDLCKILMQNQILG